MFLLMTIAVAACLAQLATVGSWARSVRFTTLVLAATLGFYACGLVAVGLEWVGTRIWHLATGAPLSEVVRAAAWTTDPVIEEVVKVLPLVGCWVLARRLARQLGLVDHLLVGAALGVGFELFEAAARFASVGSLNIRVPGGFLVSASLGGSVIVPTPLAAVTTWLPAPAASEALFGETGDTVQHLVWTALAAFGLGWLFRHPGRSRWFGLVPLAVVTADHVNYNARAVGGASGLFSDAVGWVGGQLPAVLVVALLAGTAADRLALARARSEHPDLLLTGEPAAGLNPAKLVGVARLAPRWTAVVAWRFALGRRAALYAGAEGDATLVEEVAAVRQQLERATDPGRWRFALPSPVLLRPQLLAAARNWRLWVWVAALVPSVAYLVIGGFPLTRGLQQAMRGQVGLWVGIASAVLTMILVVVQAPPLVRRIGTPTCGLHLVRGHALLRLGMTIGLLGGGAVVIVGALAHADHPDAVLVSNYHALDAIGRLLVIAGIALFVWGLFMFPPLAFGLAATTEGVLLPTIAITLTSELGLAAAGSLGLGAAGILLQEATDGSGRSSGGGTSSGSARSSTPTDRAKEHLTQRDLDAARRELKGEVVARKPDGTPWDHVREVRETQTKLVNRIKALKRLLGDTRASESEKAAARAELSEASRLLDWSRQFVPAR